MLRPDTITAFRAQLRGRLIEPRDTGYDEARKVYNAMIDRRPRLIVQCRDVADVMAGVRFARENGLLLALRGGGHNGGGLGTCDDGLVLDLGPMKGIHVNAAAATVRIEPGCTWADVDHATQAFGLAVPSGIIGSTGVAGLTLGGGFGHLARRHGLTVDNLLEADVVLADGSFVTASAEQHADLFWALRGGGGNFGVVTSFKFRAHAQSLVYAGPTFWPMAETPRVMRWYERFMAKAPPELNGFFALMKIPPAEPYPPQLHLMPVCAVIWCWSGDPAEGEAALKPAAEFGPPLVHAPQPMPYPMIQSALDPLVPAGLQWYWRADFFDELSDAAIAEHARFGAQLPTWRSTMHLYPVDGAVHRVGTADTPFSYRSSRWAQVIVGIGEDPSEAAAITDWTKRYHDALHPHSAGGAYINMLMDESPDRVRASFRGNYERLVAIKRRYDPGNLFRVNQNIKPD